ncbi:MAG: SDR family NAD(P)-dependent oxidoreductase [Alphaproteobacteria bacterium]|jgi:NAD(P)-dependent dehydrogenase (short-subunit alcohol dehydrogenase family)|nr:SDR family NAD(P)-dependent oxidoreductase [Alphaproteobacteria bacterium]MDP6589292.1 SDR family NAD(P)-dependent oxidoreductase [Alphaproteobacteria bacterium]MDP6817259.1 SDR family NAD(P)-dependent oxidoreductase [Alphaproteobacteria bacterium]|tara:strand:+ start:583 stop:1347 length:765 start_codon:yes stop_codon:yes gene_type:complete
MEIKGQTAFVTGGASGLGEATARMMAAAGATVGVLDMNEELAQKVANELGGAAAVCDVSDAASHEAAMASLRQAIGPARIFIACAGIATGAKLVTRDGDPTPLDRLTKAIQVNLIGTINSLRLAAADMAGLAPLDDGERGVIVTTSSIAGFEGQIGQGDYSASKGGVAATALTFARELAREGIRVNCISPGLMDTPMMDGLPDEVRQSLIETTVYPKRLGHAGEYAALARHIAENRYINGTVIRLDGALRMAPR